MRWVPRWQMFSEQIREQVLGRFEPHLHEGPDGLSLGAGPDSVSLYTFQFRGTKGRSSLALKLLQRTSPPGGVGLVHEEVRLPEGQGGAKRSTHHGQIRIVTRDHIKDVLLDEGILVYVV